MITSQFQIFPDLAEYSIIVGPTTPFLARFIRPFASNGINSLFVFLVKEIPGGHTCWVFGMPVKLHHAGARWTLLETLLGSMQPVGHEMEFLPMNKQEEVFKTLINLAWRDDLAATSTKLEHQLNLPK
ncbi:hypothetical protein [Methylomonas sp. MK1]|uniref:hypothetical protein n=1 Tax=Methylomonas sp. MK1 TaxID=1131552 RepID=UPI001268130A|nr:hypothetical protein [Methylomonas sp. MK1]